jgi:hypothetical protein
LLPASGLLASYFAYFSSLHFSQTTRHYIPEGSTTTLRSHRRGNIKSHMSCLLGTHTHIRNAPSECIDSFCMAPSSCALCVFINKVLTTESGDVTPLNVRRIELYLLNFDSFQFRRVPDYDTIWSGRLVPMFWTNLLSPSSGLANVGGSTYLRNVNPHLLDSQCHKPEYPEDGGSMLLQNVDCYQFMRYQHRPRQAKSLSPSKPPVV